MLWYPDFLRMIIPSANLIELDWTDMANVIYVQDFPQGGTPSPWIIPFKTMLTDMHVPLQVIQRFDGYDYSQGMGQFVYSMPGNKNGHRMLKTIVSKFGTDFSQASLVYQASSLGKTDEKWARDFVGSCRASPGPVGDFKLVYPSVDMICQSKLGPLGGGSFFFDAKYWTPFIQNLARECSPVRPKQLMHSKIMLCYLPSFELKPQVYINRLETEPKAYLYCGSHNCTRSAWGVTYSNGKFNINNWELGLVFKLSSSGSPFTLPFHIPPPVYNKTIPWNSQHMATYFE